MWCDESQALIFKERKLGDKQAKFIIKNNKKITRPQKTSMNEETTKSEGVSKLKNKKKAVLQKTQNTSHNLGISMTQKPFDEFDEDESREIANQIGNKTVFHIKVEELKRKDSSGVHSTLDSSYGEMAILEVNNVGKNLVKRWQMNEKNHFVINLNQFNLVIWVADKNSQSLDKILISKETTKNEDIEIQSRDLSIKLSIKRENINESDCSVMLKRHSITMFMFQEGEVPLSGENEEDSAKPMSNRAVQMISAIEDYKGNLDDGKKLKKYESMKSPPNTKDSHFKSMKTTEFVLKEILERKEQDISLDEAQNDGMRSPRQHSEVAKEGKAGGQQPVTKVTNEQDLDLAPAGKQSIRTPDIELNNFDSFNTKFEPKPNISGVKREVDEYDDFDMLPKDSKSRNSLVNDRLLDK